MTGVLKGVSGSRLVFVDGSSLEVSANASVSLNGTACALSELRGGDNVNANGDPASKVTATR